ncbi:MAG: DUF4255 domain-containing protein [Saprospiraceae bacterium]
MLNHSLLVIVKELNAFLDAIPGAQNADDLVVLGNIGQVDSATHTSDGTLNIKDKIVLTVVNIREEKTLKNSLNYSKKNTGPGGSVEYHNPPVFLNSFLLFSANTNNYTHALAYLSRVIRFFQSRNVFTHRTVADTVTGLNDYDRLEEFKLILDLYSPTFEELNHLWGTLGGKQIPAVLYQMRMLEMKHHLVQDSRSVIEEIVIGEKAIFQN